MKKISLITLLITLFFSALFGQTIKQKKIKKKAVKVDWEKNYKEEFSDCSFTSKYTAQQRLTMYPFVKAAKVLAVSFKYEGMYTEGDDQLSNFEKRGLHFNNRVLDTSTLIEMKVLNVKQIEQLTNLIFNTGYKTKWEFHIQDSRSCFESRNALVFIDDKGILLDYLELCFHCKRSRSMSDEFDIGVPCNEKYQFFSDYFKGVGVPYGTLGKDYREEDNKYFDELRKQRSKKP